MSWLSNLFSKDQQQPSEASTPPKPLPTAADCCERGQKSLESGKYVEAMEYFQAAIESDKHFEKAYLLLATAYEKQGKKDMAKAALYSLLAVEPNNENALKSLEVLIGVVKAEKANNENRVNDGKNESDPIGDSGKNNNGVTQQPRPIQVGNYRIFDGKPEDRFDFFVIFDDGNRLYFKTKNSNEVAIVSPAKYGWEGYKKPSGNMDIPSSIDFKGQQYIVKTIAEYAFSLCNLQSVRIPDTVSEIESGAFNKCSILSSVKLPLMLESIGNSCFYMCGFNKISIPDSVKHIGSSAFSRCYNLVSFRFPSGVTKIENNVLTGCSKLSQIVIPKNVSEIEQNAFGDGMDSGYRSSNAVELKIETEIPPKINAKLFQMWRSEYAGSIKVTIIVPKGALDAYITAQYWQEFDIKEDW